jgi:hypothetical protein
MVVLNFTLTPEAASKIHDLLVCLGKFSDTVAIEARRERVGHIILYLSSGYPSYISHLSSLSPLSTRPNLHMLPPPSTADNSLPDMNAYQPTVGLTDALPAAFILELCSPSSKRAYMTHWAAMALYPVVMCRYKKMAIRAASS